MSKACVGGTRKKRDLRKRHHTDVISPFPLNYPPWRERRYAREQVHRERREPGDPGVREASGEEDEGGRRTWPEEEAGRRDITGRVTSGVEKGVRKGDPEGAREEGMARRSPKRKEAALRYRLQMTAFILSVAGKS